jgi:hypothetical protein
MAFGELLGALKYYGLQEVGQNSEKMAGVSFMIFYLLMNTLQRAYLLR